MNCFDCAHRVEGRFPAKWDCAGNHPTDPVMGLTIEYMKVGCRIHWTPKPKPTEEDYLVLYEEMEKAKDDFQRGKLMQKFKFRFQVRSHLKTQKSHQLKLL